MLEEAGRLQQRPFTQFNTGYGDLFSGTQYVPRGFKPLTDARCQIIDTQIDRSQFFKSA